MKHLACLGFALSIALNSFLVVWAAPGVNLGVIKFGGEKTFDKNYENVKSKIYNIITTITTKKGKCTKHVTVTGNGIGDVFDLPCNENGVISTTSDKLLIYGNPKEDSFFLFSDEPSKLIVFQDGKCTKKTYTTNNKKTSSMMSELKDEDCKKIEKKVIFIEEEEKKYLLALHDHVNGKDAKPSGDRGTSSQASSGANSKFKASDTNKDADSPTKNQKPVSVSHQETSNNGLTVTEGSSKNTAPASGQATAAQQSSDTTTGYYRPFQWSFQNPNW